MSRLEKKCFVASAAMHALLLTLLFLGPVILISKRRDLTRPVLMFIPTMATDKMVVGGGSPTVTQPPAPALQAQAQALEQPQPTPPMVDTKAPPEPAAATPKKPDIETKVEEPKHIAKKKIEPDLTVAKPVTKNGLEPSKKKKKESETKTQELEAVSTPGKHKVEPSFEEVRSRSTGTESSQAKSRAEILARAQAAQRAYAAHVGKLVDQLGQGLSSGTSIEAPGPGGAAYANYGLIIEAIFSQRWMPPADLNDDAVVVHAKILIRKDGTVIDARIIKSSGHRALDKSVDRALDIKLLPAFPDGAKDMERLFYIDFDLKTKRLLG